jgi:hypothetical protein
VIDREVKSRRLQVWVTPISIDAADILLRLPKVCHQSFDLWEKHVVDILFHMIPASLGVVRVKDPAFASEPGICACEGNIIFGGSVPARDLSLSFQCESLHVSWSMPLITQTVFSIYIVQLTLMPGTKCEETVEMESTENMSSKIIL